MGRLPAQDEFPLLEPLGLYAAPITGDGNCLFNALSDQIRGDQSYHREIRARVVQHMRDHADYFKQFVDVQPGGGIRRNPKRKNAGSYSSSFIAAPPTPEEIDAAFGRHLQEMAKGGVFGDNMEIVAFSATYKVDVKIYQKDSAYMISSSSMDDCNAGVHWPIAHIAYHTWEHYSSIRNTNGPHTGIPHVKASTSPASPGAVVAAAKVNLENDRFVAPWLLEQVRDSLPPWANFDRATALKILVKNRGKLDDTVSELLEIANDDASSCGSTQVSSSVERDPDSGDEEGVNGRKKRQDRRASRATRSLAEASAGDVKLEDGARSGPNSLSLGLAHRPKNPSSTSPLAKSEISTQAEPSNPHPLREQLSNTVDSAKESQNAKPQRLKKPDRAFHLTDADDAGADDNPNEDPDWTDSKGKTGGGGRGGVRLKKVPARDRKMAAKAAQKAAAKTRKQQHLVDFKTAPVQKGGRKANMGSTEVASEGIRTLYV